MREDLPEPETPVTVVKVPIGIFKFTPFKLLDVTFFKKICLLFLAFLLYLVI